jgi:ribose transport system permease protein
MSLIETPNAESDDASPAPKKLGRRTRSGIWTSSALIVAWIAVIVLFTILEGSIFFSSSDFGSIFSTQSALLVLSLALIPPFCAGEFDLSIAGTMGIVYVLLGYLTINDHWGLFPALLVCLAATLVIASVNAFLIVRLGLESIVVTLGMGTLLYGLGYALLEGPIVGIPSGLVTFVSLHVGVISMQFLLAIVLVLIMWYVFSFTPLGRYFYVVGSSRAVAKLSGIPVNKIRAGSFFASAILAGFAAVILSGATGAADPSTASGYLLEAFAAVFLGATAITPGRFNSLGTFISVYFLTTGVTGLELKGESGWVVQVFYGGALIVGVALSRLIGVATKVSKE